MKKHFQYLTIITLLILGSFPVRAQQSPAETILDEFDHHPEHILVAAHRSAHQKYPENSLAAMKEAIRLGVDIIEIDIRQTSDGELVVMHDAKVDRTTDGKGAVSSFSFEELRKLNLLFEGNSTTEKVPAFEEVLQLAKDKIMIDIDFKLEDKDAAIKTYQLIEKYGMQKQVLFFLYQYKYAPYAYKLDPEVKIMPRAYSAADAKDILDFGYIKILHADDKFYTDSLMKNIQDAGLRVWMNALGKYDDMEASKKDSGFKLLLEKKHLNVIQTNLPGELLDYLKRNHLHR